VASYELDVRETGHNGVVLVELAGELDLTAAPELERKLDEAGDRGSSALVLDLNGVSFLDSAALHVLFRVARRLEQRGMRFGIVLEPTALVARTLSIVGLDEVTLVRPSLDEIVNEHS
jgi:anti-sigma B factor antagonist